MKKDFDDDDDLEELDDDGVDGEKDGSDSEDYDYDDDLDDLEELEDEEDAKANVKTGAAPFPSKEKADDLAEVEEDAWEEEEARKAPSSAKLEKKVDDDDSSFFEEALDEEDDLGITREPAAHVAEPVTATPKVSAAAPFIAAETAKPAAKGAQPVLIILPAIAILLGIGLYFFKGGKSEDLAPGLPTQLGKTAPAIQTPAFKKPKIDDSIPDHYEEMKRIEISDPLKIASLADRGLLKKNAEDSSREVGKLTLVLYKTDVRYVVSQTYHYTDGGKWTVETQFSDLGTDPEEVAKAFDDVYAG